MSVHSQRKLRQLAHVAPVPILAPCPAGVVCAMASDDSQSAAAAQPDLAMRDELTTQLALAPQRFVAINTAGVVELEKRRPLDTLALILEERNAGKLEQLFRSYGAAEVAAMCFALATQSPSQLPQASFISRPGCDVNLYVRNLVSVMPCTLSNHII